MLEKFQNNKGGFIRLIILIVIMLLIMKYFDITFYDMIDVLKKIFGGFFNKNS